MTKGNIKVNKLATDILSQAEIDEITALSQTNPFDLVSLIAIDKRFGGPGFSNINDERTGRYELTDEDIFRPLQYCAMHFEMVAEGSKAEWLPRFTIQMCGLQLEGLVKRISKKSKLPLGAALNSPLAIKHIESSKRTHLIAFSKIYNDAKHTVSASKDSHLFAVQDMVLVYIISRILSMHLYNKVQLVTDLSIFQ